MSRAFMIKQAPFKPTDIGGCQLWLDGADSTTITGNVTSIREKANNVSLSVSGTVTATTIGSQSSLSFGGSGYLSGSVNSLLIGTSFIVFKATSTNSASNPYFPFFTWRDNLSQNNFPAFGYVPGGVIAPYTTYIGLGTPATAVTIGNTYLTSYSWSGTTTAVGFNGTTPTSGTQPAFTSTETLLWIAYDNQAQTLAANIGEILLYNSVLGTSQRQQVESYLAQKWGLRQQLPQGHPGTQGIVYPSQPIPTAIYWRYPTPFVPTSIGGCQLWLDGVDPAGTGTSPSNGATVSTWVDKATAKNATATGTSTYLTGGGINFTGSSYFLNQTFSQNLSQRSIFIVFQETTNSQYAGVFPIIPTPNSGNDQSTSTGLSSETTNNTLSFVGISYFSSVGSGNPLPKAIYYDSMNGTTGSGYFNGTNATNVTAGYTAGTCSGYGLGGRWQAGSMSGSYRLNGVIYEILFFDTSLNTLNRQTIEGYLAWKWALQSSLPSNHPYKNVSPNITNPGGVSRPANVLPIPPITCTPVSKIRTLVTQIFTYTGSIQTYTVPAGVTSVVLYMWGAGGGTSQPVGGFVNYSGGAGAMVQGVYPVTPASTLYVVVGKGGVTNQSIQTDAQGGGGAANSAGGGGGRSAIQLTSGGADVVVAGGGGGGGLLYANNNGTGGPAYFSGSSPNTLAAVVGYGGTQTAGGAGGGNGGGAGSLKFGGAGTGPGAGGGGGYYGGGGMGNGDQGWCPGGGGSSLIDNLSLIPGESVFGFNSTNLSGAPNTTSPYYVSNVAAGGIGANATGGNGRVVVGYYL